MGPTKRVAAAQTTPRAGDVEANLAQHLALLEAAADAGAQLVLFPELSLTGYEPACAKDLAFSPVDPRLAPLQALCTNRDLTAVVGAPARLGDRVFIAALIVTPERGVDVYTKHHLGAFGASAAVDGEVPPPEVEHFSVGTANPLVDVAGARAAIGICADVGQPRHSQEAARRGAELYLASMFVIPSELEREQRALAEIARTRDMSVVFANYGAPTGGLRAAGRSAAWAHGGAELGQLEPEGTGLLLVGAGPTEIRGI